MVLYWYSTSFPVVKRLISQVKIHQPKILIFVISFEKSSKSNHQRYKTSVAFADFLIGAFVLPLVLVQRYYAAKLQLGSTINSLTVHDSKVVDP